MYQYGPDNIRDIKRADFLIKQAVIDLGVLDDNNLTKKAFQNFTGDDDPFPSSLEKHMDWYSKVQKSSPEDRRITAFQLSQEGFTGLNPIWHNIEDGEPSDFSLLEFADIYADPPSDFYDMKKAKYYYFQIHIQSFGHLHDTDDCKSHFTDALDIWKNKNDIQHDVLSNILDFCQLSNKNLFKVAEDFEFV